MKGERNTYTKATSERNDVSHENARLQKQHIHQSTFRSLLHVLGQKETKHTIMQEPPPLPSQEISIDRCSGAPHERPRAGSIMRDVGCRVV